MELTTIHQSVAFILQRDLKKIIAEIEQYQTEESVWVKEGIINNSGGNLALHIAGAVQHFIGAVLGGNGYKREREKEFTITEVPRVEIVEELQRAIHATTFLDQFPASKIWDEYPEKVGGKTFTTGFFLIHLTGHINYHLGQINYHRRLLSS